jgi:hypothetical protein
MIELLEEKRRKRAERALEVGGAITVVESNGDFVVVVPAVVFPPRSRATASVRAAARVAIVCTDVYVTASPLPFSWTSKSGASVGSSRGEREKKVRANFPSPSLFPFWLLSSLSLCLSLSFLRWLPLSPFAAPEQQQ